MKKGHIKIERGIPIPDHAGKKGYTALIRSLKKGDSVLLPIIIQNATSLCYQISADRELFTRRSVEGGTRVWRIK